jgi:hypothetical protein
MTRCRLAAVETANDLRLWPFRATEQLIVATIHDGDATAMTVVCLECGSSGTRATGNDPPGHVVHLWNQRFGVDHKCRRLIVVEAQFGQRMNGRQNKRNGEGASDAGS